jgi:23S rRNA pseudouridine1911/1915/1917 synthase
VLLHQIDDCFDFLDVFGVQIRSWLRLRRFSLKQFCDETSSAGIEGWSDGVADSGAFDLKRVRYSITPITPPLHFQIVDETDDYVVVDKPPFLLIHPTKPDCAPTLWKQLRELLAFEIASGGQVSIVNRLDRETSGLVLVAKTATAARDFGLRMQRQQLRKEYLAIVWGWPEWEHKIVDAPLDRQGRHQRSAIWLKQMIHPAGTPALTQFRVERRFTKSTSFGDRFSLIRAFPHTGRTHQIRVHLSSLGHSIVGDKIYGPDEQLYLRFIETGWTPEFQEKLLLPRHALHSVKLATDDKGEWTSELAPDLADFCGGDASG